MNKEEELLSKRIQELARLADVKYCPTYTDFLNLNEQNILQQTLPKLAVGSGGMLWRVRRSRASDCSICA